MSAADELLDQIEDYFFWAYKNKDEAVKNKWMQSHWIKTGHTDCECEMSPLEKKIYTFENLFPR